MFSCVAINHICLMAVIKTIFLKMEVIMKKTITISLLLLVTFAVTNTFAWQRGPGRGIMGQGYNQGCQGYSSAANDLSKEQRDQLDALQQKFIDDTYEFRSAIFAANQKIQMLMDTSNPDKKQISGLSDKILNSQKQLRDKRIDFELRAKKIDPKFGTYPRSGYGCRKGSGQGGCKMLR